MVRSEREPWLVIDLKPFVGDPAYDAPQYLFNCDARLRCYSDDMPIADLLEVDQERVSTLDVLPAPRRNRATTGAIPIQQRSRDCKMSSVLLIETALNMPAGERHYPGDAVHLDSSPIAFEAM